MVPPETRCCSNSANSVATRPAARAGAESTMASSATLTSPSRTSSGPVRVPPPASSCCRSASLKRRVSTDDIPPISLSRKLSASAGVRLCPGSDKRRAATKSRTNG